MLTVIIICFLIVIAAMAILSGILYKNERRAVKREGILKNDLKAANLKVKGMEYTIYKLESEKDSLCSELDNQKQLSDILNEHLEIRNARIAELELIIKRTEEKEGVTGDEKTEPEQRAHEVC